MALRVHFRGSFAPSGCDFFSIQPILIEIGMLEVVSVPVPYLISKIKKINMVDSKWR